MSCRKDLEEQGNLLMIFVDNPFLLDLADEEVSIARYLIFVVKKK